MTTPRHASEYRGEDTELVKAGCLTVAAQLGNLMEEIVIIGGYVPTLLLGINVDGEASIERHVGTRDLDLAFSVSILDDEKYMAISEQLHQAGFVQDVNQNSNPTPQRWTYKGLKLDFLMPPLDESDKPGSTKHLEANFGATIIPGAELAHIDFVRVEIEGTTLDGAQTTQQIKVCGPAAYLVLKGLAMGKRGKNKDDYDAYYIVRNHSALHSFGKRFADFVHDRNTRAVEALEVYRARFHAPDSVGSIAVSQFVYGENNSDLLADVSAYFREFLNVVDVSLALRGR